MCTAAVWDNLDSARKGSLAKRTGDTRSALKLSILAIKSGIGSEEVGARLYQSSPAILCVPDETRGGGLLGVILLLLTASPGELLLLLLPLLLVLLVQLVLLVLLAIARLLFLLELKKMDLFVVCIYLY